MDYSQTEQVKFLKRQLAAKFAVEDDYRADFWELVPADLRETIDGLNQDPTKKKRKKEFVPDDLRGTIDGLNQDQTKKTTYFFSKRGERICTCRFAGEYWRTRPGHL